MKKINIVVIGVGSLGEKHARIYKNIPDANLAAVCDIDKTKANHLAAELGVMAYRDYTELDCEKIDGVSICAPTNLHYKIARYFLGKGVHVLVEKPFTKSLKEASGLIKMAKKAKLIIQVGHIERFNSAFEAIEPIVKNPKFIECHRLSHFPGRSLDVGAVLDIMIHDIDILLGLVKSPISSIEAVGVKVLTQYEDIANARIKFKNGCIANLTASRVSDETMRKIRIFLPNVYISLDYFKQEGFIYRKSGRQITKKPITIEKEQPLQKELAAFIDCLKYKKRPLVSGEQAYQALELAQKIIQKIHE